MIPAVWLALPVAIGAFATLYFVFGSFLFGAGYQPTFRASVRRMLELAEVGPEDTLYDLGAGTGAILFRAARKNGARAVGVEIEPIRILVLRLRRAVGGPRDRVRILWGNLFAVDLREATVVALFLWPEAMRRLRPILESQLPPGARVVSHWHEVPGWVPRVYDPTTRVYLYHRGADGSGRGADAPAAPVSSGLTGGR
ncbi:MAG: SAM-dependent methyltransferase [Thermoplasmata archaeon]